MPPEPFRMLRYSPGLLLIMISTTVCAQNDSVRVVTNTRVITRADLPDQVVYDNAILLQPATFPGGEEALRAHFTNALDPSNNPKASAEISFVVEPDGSVNEVQVNKGIAADTDKSILRAALAMPNWTPAMVKDRPVRAKVLWTVSLGS